MKRVILASISPRRRYLMRLLGLPFKAVASNYHEVHHRHLTPPRLVKFLAEGKAAAAARNYRDAIIIGADTIVVYKNKVYGKPKDRRDAERMLQELSGKRHRVLTGLCAIDAASGKKQTAAVKLEVYFRVLNKRVIKNYLAAVEPLDKAGAYAVQGIGMGLIRRVEGELTNGIGLPLETLARMLKKFGIRV